MEYKIKTSAKLIITDYGFLEPEIENWWFKTYTDNFLVYDRQHRFTESNKVIHQKNVGCNIYDIFDFVYSNYDNLPEIMIFCKGNVVPRHCGFEKFNSIINNLEFTSIENYIRESPKYQPNIYAYVDEDDGYHENPIEVNNTVNLIHFSKYIFSYEQLLSEIFENPTFSEYIRFAPGGNYIIPKNDILRYNKLFYKTMREYVSWHPRPGEAFLLERALYTIYKNNFEIKNKYRTI